MSEDRIKTLIDCLFTLVGSLNTVLDRLDNITDRQETILQKIDEVFTKSREDFFRRLIEEEVNREIEKNKLKGSEKFGSNTVR